MKKPYTRKRHHCESCGRRINPDASARPRVMQCWKCRGLSPEQYVEVICTGHLEP